MNNAGQADAFAYIYDHVRTPRGKGKKDGSLHQASPVWLLSTLLRAMQQQIGRASCRERV